MKRLTPLVFTSLLMVPVAGIAEEPVAAFSDQRLANMQRQLELTDEQVQEMRSIRDEGGDRKAMSAVLSEEQQQLRRDLKQQRLEKKAAGQLSAEDR
ncbi:hypothetical protein F0M18_16185 [Pseudohalioglobus sediminis]|uniref:LTXXQ motif family protein n=1 Tax=Pseudohalioglobus sediminis TaxID=2606449 RepID=A0A5B0WQC4_9GAMM|nr:hypothetical protein [Pseudohalioglobus sediminis]KAA1189212.1 hypothetical protein F0M18_16185 [Pseudohalioglobus sediminis]